jgi:hypothetical protein
MSRQPQDEDLSAFVAALDDARNFPAGVRLFCDQRLVAGLPPHLHQRCEWPGAAGGLLLGAACGAAVAEEPRGGAVLVLVPPAALEDPLLRQAAVLATRVRATVLTLGIVGGDASSLALLREQDWRTGGAGPLVRIFPPFEPVSSSGAVPLLRQRGEWQPVRLRTTQAGVLPPWPVDEMSVPLAACGDWLAWLSSREPDLVVANLAAPWREQPPGPVLLAALGQLAAEGRRVCWRIPTGTDLRPYFDVLHHIGRRGLPLKLLIAASDLPSRPSLASLVGWWVLVPTDAPEAAAMLAHALDTEDAVLIGLLPSVPVMLPPWPEQHAFVPGSGRWLRPGGDATLVCDHRTVAVAAAAATTLAHDGVQVGVLICTSLMPLPIGELDRVGSGPVVACGHDLGVALASALTDRDARIHTASDITSAHAVVAAVRQWL